MSEKKEEKGQAATDRLKAAALSAAKGLSRTQAEKAANAATRNVNAYGQKEEGPSRWQERKEMKRQMYLMSTEKQVRLGVRKDPKANVASTGVVASQCQKCFQGGHWTYECKNERVYISRPSRSQLLKNPKLRQKMMPSYTEDNPDIIKEREENEEDEEKKKKKDEKVEKRKKKSKRKYKSDTESSRSEGSESESESESDGRSSDSGSGSSYSSSSESEERRSRKKDKKKQDKGRRHKSKRYSSSSASESSDYESSSGSESEGRKRRKSGKHSRRR